jgi:hypothetical protein
MPLHSHILWMAACHSFSLTCESWMVHSIPGTSHKSLSSKPGLIGATLFASAPQVPPQALQASSAPQTFLEPCQGTHWHWVATLTVLCHLSLPSWELGDLDSLTLPSRPVSTHVKPPCKPTTRPKRTSQHQDVHPNPWPHLGSVLAQHLPCQHQFGSTSISPNCRELTPRHDIRNCWQLHW